MKKMNMKMILFVRMVFTILGALLAIVMYMRTMRSNPNLLSILSSSIYLIAYCALIVYSTYNYNKKEIYFKGVIYAYAALLGIQILQYGQFIAEMGLSENMTLLINCCNLISFANVIKFADFLQDKKSAIGYIGVAVILKWIMEMGLIVSMLQYVQVMQALTALSVPILGGTVLVAYLHRNAETADA